MKTRGREEERGQAQAGCLEYCYQGKGTEEAVEKRKSPECEAASNAKEKQQGDGGAGVISANGRALQL